jgi:hypothetical protein
MTRHPSRLGVFFAGVLSLGVAAWLAVAVIDAAPQGTGGGAAAAAAKPTPRTADGHPDLSGMWYRRLAGPVTKRVGKSIVIVNDAPPVEGAGNRYNPGTPKYKPQFLARIKDLKDDQINVDPAFHCGPPGVPRIGPPQRIVQTPRELVIMYDDLNGNFFRLIPIDGRKHRTGIEPSAHGDSVGRWEGDTLVIEAKNYKRWSLDDWYYQNPKEYRMHTEALRTVERLRRVDVDTIAYEFTVDDPKIFTKPWSVEWVMKRHPEWEKTGLYEMVCNENNRCEGGNCRK